MMRTEIVAITITLMMLMIMIEMRFTTMMLLMMIRTMEGEIWGVVMVVTALLTGSLFHLDGERQSEGTDANRKRDVRSSAGHHKSEDASDSREDEAAVSLSFLCTSTDHTHPHPSD